MMMASAFYPTGDGHVGNLGKKTLPELKDLLARQERLIQKKNFLNSLPDKGAKILQFAEILQRTIKSREKSEEIFGRTSSNETNVDIIAISKEGHKGMSRFKKEREKEKEIHSKDNNPVKSTVHIESNRPQEHIAFSGDILEHSFKNLSVEDDGKAAYVKGDHSIKPKHFYEIAEERAKHNATELKEPLKLNSSLRVSTVHDLPEQFHPPNLSIHKIEEKMDLDKHLMSSNSSDTSNPGSHQMFEETAATPPTYKYDRAKEISLDEALTLQKSQKVKQDELQAEIAAERLADRLHIKLEAYNPEGVDMSYRVRRSGGQAHMIDSDDDDDEDFDYEDAVKIISDSDDDS